MKRFLSVFLVLALFSVPAVSFAAEYQDSIRVKGLVMGEVGNIVLYSDDATPMTNAKGTNCPGSWACNSAKCIAGAIDTSTANFKIIYAALMSALLADKTVIVYTSGCMADMAKIFRVDIFK